MIQPRNTLVLVRLIEKATRQVGAITVPTNTEMYTEAEVLAVGPGTQMAEGGRTETFDLKPGQLVFVKHKERRNPNPNYPASLAGIEYKQDGGVFYVFEQSSIVGIIAEAGEWTPAAGTPPFTVPANNNLILPA
jgi:co-chaperonin GroES (HSP10)